MSAENLRNLTFLGAADAGKTSLVEAIAHMMGATDRLGSVADGTSLCDFTPEEREKKHSLGASVVHLEGKGSGLNLVDTPGYPDFVSDAITSMGACGIAVLVVAANNESVPFHARRLWRLAGQAKLARAVVVTKVDHDNLALDKIIATLRAALGNRLVPVSMPNATGAGFNAVAEADASHRSVMVEAIVESDDALMERYLETGEVSDAELDAAVPGAIAKGTLSPLFFADPMRSLGVQPLVDWIIGRFPTAAMQARVVSVPEVDDAAAGSRLVMHAWKVLTDKHLGQISYLRVLQGTVKADQLVPNPRGGKAIKLGGLSFVFGKDLKPVAQAASGDIVAVSRIDEIEIGDVLVSEGEAEVRPFPVPAPYTAFAVRPKSRADEQKISSELSKIAKEDPSFRVRRNAATHEMIVEGLSELHLQTCLHRLEARGVGAETSLPRIAYQETITAAAEGHHRHKKQTGGSGQFGEVYLRVAPRERGSGYEFVNAIKGASIPTQYLPAVDKGIQEQMEKGILAHSTLVDLRVEVYDGKHHDVDSDEVSFKMAGAKALQDAFVKARPILLEPIMEVDITVPARYFGDVSGDLNTRRGRILGMESEDDVQIIKAHVPLAEMQGYSTPLRSMTHGEGSFTMKFDHNDQVPSHIQEKIVAELATIDAH
ncbi:MAG TPA: elongation factor G [Planctomycetota bacterium]